MFIWVRWVLIISASAGVYSKESQDVTLRDGHSRIVEGHPADEGQFPYHVTVKTFRGNRCWVNGGAIISYQFVLTAANTFVGEEFVVDSGTSISIFVGSVKANQGQEFQIAPANVFPHESFQKNPLMNDIALIKTSSPILFTCKLLYNISQT